MSRTAPGITLVPIGFGELIDKITILEIKLARIADAAKLANVRHELDLLLAALAEMAPPPAALAELRQQLLAVNETLWDVEDALRDCERAGEFGPRFVELARRVYITNDRRAALKRALNSAAGSAIIEEKSYAAY